MPGGLIQIVSHGKQDLFLSGSPTITFFDAVYKRHTNFASEFIDLSFSGNLNPGNRISLKIPRSGDLISKMAVSINIKSITPSSNFAWVKKLGHAILKEIEIYIGGKQYDIQYGLWLDIWYSLAGKKDHEFGYNVLIGNVKELTKYNKKKKPEYNLIIPLQFWFNRFYSSSIPLIAIQQDYDVEIRILLEDLNKLIIVDSCTDIENYGDGNGSVIKDISLLTNYIYLDSYEREKFVKKLEHQYLIEQLQLIGPNSTKIEKNRINFNRTVKEIVWVTQCYNSGIEYLYYDNIFNDKTIKKAASKLLYESFYNTDSYDSASCNSISLIKVMPYDKKRICDLYIFNKTNKAMYFNEDSLVIRCEESLVKKISAEIIISDTDIDIKVLSTSITIDDLSTPISEMRDGRNKGRVRDPIVYDHFNYGVNIDGSINPTERARIVFNDIVRVDDREGDYYNYIEPEKRHSCIPCPGVNNYSFSLFPEEFQPSGSANIRYNDTFIDITYRTERVNPDRCKTSIFGTNYNVMRISQGYCDMAN